MADLLSFPPKKPDGRRARRGTETRQRQRRLTYRITEAEYAEVQTAAEREGLTLASYARARTVGAPVTRSRRAPSTDLLALAKALATVNKMGGLLHQIAKHLNFGGYLEPGELQMALAGYEAMVAALMSAIGRSG